MLEESTPTKYMGFFTYLIAALTSSYEALFSSLHVKSTTETFGVGTLKAIPVSFPLSSGRTFPTAYDDKCYQDELRG